MLLAEKFQMMINNFTAWRTFFVEMADDVLRFLGYFKELFFLMYLSILPMTLQIRQMLIKKYVDSNIKKVTQNKT